MGIPSDCPIVKNGYSQLNKILKLSTGLPKGPAVLNSVCCWRICHGAYE